MDRDAMDRDAYAEQLAGIGLDLAVRIRDESPDDAARVLDGLTHRQLRDLAVVLAAHVPVDLPRSVLTGWWTHPPDRAAAAAAAEWIASEYQRVEGT